MKKDQPDPRLEITLAIIAIGFSALIYWGTIDLPPPRFEPLGSASVPRMLAGTMAILSAIWLALSVVKLRSAEPVEPQEGAEPETQKHPLLAVSILMITIVFVAIMDLGLLGFVAAGIPYVVLCGFLMTHRSLQALPWVVGYAVILILSVNYVFTEFFYINLP